MRIGKRHGDDRVLCDGYDCHSARTRGGRLQVTFTHAQTQTRLCCRFDKRKRVTAQLLLVNMPMTRQTGRYRRGATS
jgi:hypothetical protein